MGRILFFLLLAIAAYIGYRIWQIRSRRPKDAAAARSGKSEPMIRCEQCGLNIPRSDAVTEAGSFYCSEAHRLLHRSSR